MKTIKVKYFLEVIQNVAIDENTPSPKPYTPEEWEEQQILDVGYVLVDALPSRMHNWYYEIISDPKS